jgi:hypothetical protein
MTSRYYGIAAFVMLQVSEASLCLDSVFVHAITDWTHIQYVCGVPMHCAELSDSILNPQCLLSSSLSSPPSSVDPSQTTSPVL